MSDQARATVIVVNWNGERLLRACLDALARQQTRAPFHTWVVDNGSSDASVPMLEREYPAVRVLRNATNLGFAGGNNTALRQVATPYAVLLNNDATPEADWLEQLLAPFDQPGGGALAAVTSKVVFQPRFLRITLSTLGFMPGAADTRQLGLRLHDVCVEDLDVTDRVLWERSTWGLESVGPDRFRWTRPRAELLVPLPEGHAGPYKLGLRWAAETTKAVTLSWDGGQTDLQVSPSPTFVVVELPAGMPALDVVNNVGSLVTRGGYGADRGYQEVDSGQYDEAVEVFALCGCAVAFRTEAGRTVGWFDETFFLYYEDTDLSWRLRAAGWDIRYQPTAVVRHVHAASSVEWSPTFAFHTTRNRLLMLAKNAAAGRATREYLRFLLETLQMLRPVLGQLRRGRRPALAPLRSRLRVLRSLLRLTPGALLRRAVIARTAEVSRDELERWLVTTR